MRERTQAEIEAALTAYHGADGWDHNDRADMRAALVAADAVAPARIAVQLTADSTSSFTIPVCVIIDRSLRARGIIPRHGASILVRVNWVPSAGRR